MDENITESNKGVVIPWKECAKIGLMVFIVSLVLSAIFSIGLFIIVTVIGVIV